MAGGGGALEVGHKPKRGKQSHRKAKKRLGFKLDMTPLVDITFLLLTFFMFTTTMLKPQVMEMKMPKNDSPEDSVIVNEEKLLTILVSPDNKVYWYDFKNALEPPVIAIKDIAALAVKMNLSDIAKNDLITTLKVSDKAKYETVVKILDELNIAEAQIIDKLSQEKDPTTGGAVKRQRKFTFAPMTDEDMVKIDPKFVAPPKPTINNPEGQ